ncbi:MFS transporter [Kribbella sp. NBC_01245]|uniref:MFS transporter n=1 Tax=Kribbella sp. NBC_01245 TaxID=2903578 RepID=UPI002E27F186|nr:MFS transporter [Kribbella sp. NBC_01245]
MTRRPAPQPGQDPAEPKATYRDVFAVAEFRALWFAQLASVAGDQLARVALAVLVFDRTGSAGLSALTYALTFLPDLVAGPLLSGLADRFSRRRVMVVCDLARMLLVAVMAIPGTPLWLLCVLLVVVQFFASPFQAARAALLPSILTGEQYVKSSAVSNMTSQFAQVVGFVAGGTLVAALGAHRTLLVDAATFAVSAALVGFGIRDYLLDGDPAHRPSWLTQIAAGARLVWGDRRLRYLVLLASLMGFYITVEGLAVPYAAALPNGPVTGAVAVGVLLAANPAGTVTGMVLVTRLDPVLRIRLIRPLSIGACAPLIGCLAQPGLVVTVLLWFVSGVCSAYQLQANVMFVQSVPDAQRGQAFGLARTVMIVAQGVGILLAGMAADRWQPAHVVAAAGVLGVIAAAGAATGFTRAERAHTPA